MKKGENKIFKSKLTLVVWLMLVLILVSVTVFVTNKKSEVGFLSRLYDSLIQSESIGGVSIVKSATITDRKTGTSSFDTEEGAGNDTSESDNIVRSFDEVKWVIETTMQMKDEVTDTSATGGYLNVEVVLPAECANVVEWDIESMGWTNGTEVISSDKTTFTARYHMNENEITVPGKQSLELVLKVLGAANETEIKPEFKVWLEGNTDDEKYSFSEPDSIIVSATPKYNIKLDKNAYLANRTTLNFDGKDTTGRIYGYGVVVQLYNEDKSKGLKGLEFPKEDINFDIDLKLERSLENSSGFENITDECTPVLWNYKINQNTEDGNISGRNMKFFDSANFAANIAPIGIKTDRREESIYNSGNITMTQNGSTINTKISGYEIDGVFPKYNYTWEGAVHNTADYTENIGCFVAGYFQVFVPFNEASTMEDRNYYFSVTNSNLNITSASDKVVTNQMITNDDTKKVSFTSKKIGEFSQTCNIRGYEGYLITSRVDTGDIYAYPGQKLSLETKAGLSSSSDDDVYTVNKIIKFDGNGLEPILYDDNTKYKTDRYDGTMTFNVWYLCKKDGTNWISQDEMNNANIEDLLIYSSINDIPSDKICVGMYIESIDGNLARSSGAQNLIYLPVKVRENVTIGQTYGVVARSQKWFDKLDRSIYTVTNLGNFSYPTPDYDSNNREYIKVEFDEEGNVVEGTNIKGGYLGQSFIALGAKQAISLTNIDGQSDTVKTNYDLGKNENEVTYKITPSITKFKSIHPDISGITVKVKDTLPAGLTYIAGSEQNAREPDITKNEDGTTTLVWNIYNYTVGEDIEPLIFKAKIAEETANSQKFVNTVVISADNEKIGNAIVNMRTATNEIQVINLTSHRLYKEIETPVIEKNGTIKYKLTYSNRTDSVIPDFQILDILPYNKSGNGTSYSGKYTIDSITIKEFTGDTEVSNRDLKLYTTTSEDVRSINAKDENIGISDIWNEKTSGEILNEEATGFAVKGTVNANSKVEVEIVLNTIDNKEGDIYLNSATARISKDTDEMQTTEVKAQVVTRKISGMIWYDTNENGLKDESESYVSNLNVILKNTSDTQIASTTTDENGYYEFTSLEKSDYIVEINPESKYKLTVANVGTNATINNRFTEVNGKKQSEVITKLNTVDSPILTQEYENAGLIVKDAKVTVRYLDLNNNELTYTDYDSEGNEIEKSYSYEITGKVGEEYTSEKKDIDGYIYRRDTSNTNGNFTEDLVEVIYYYEYNKQDIEVTKVWNDDNDIANKRPSSVILEIYANATLKDSYTLTDTSKNTQSYIFKDLPKYDDNGNNITYTIDEKEVNEDDLKFYTKQIDENSKTITDTFTVPDEKISVTGKIEWKDNNNELQKRPESIVMQLLADGTLKESYTINDTSKEIQTYEFTGLSKYDSLANEITYTIDQKEANEGDLKFYTKQVNINTNTITNTFTVPEEKTSVTITKTWNDNNNENGVRPSTLRVFLKNGDNIVQEYTFTDTSPNTQDYTFDNLPKYDVNGDEIVYTIDEEEIEGYNKNISGTNIQNDIKEYTIKAQVEGEGGTLTGENEKLTYGSTSKNSIKITPEYGYKISKITINDSPIDFIPTQDGSYVLDKFKKVKQNIKVVVTFEKKDAVVVIRYVDSEDKDIVAQEVLKGKVGDEYSSTEKEFLDYDLKIKPENVSGKMTENPIVVKYEYNLVKGNITIKLVDEAGKPPLAGITVRIERIKEDGSIDETFTSIEKISGEDGIINITNVPVGKYKITQLNSLEGYKLNETSYEVNINKDQRDIEKVIENEKIEQILENANTGDIVIIVVVILVVAIVVLVITSKLNRSKKSKNTKK